mgnify:FL=1
MNGESRLLQIVNPYGICNFDRPAVDAGIFSECGKVRCSRAGHCPPKQLPICLVYSAYPAIP